MFYLNFLVPSNENHTFPTLNIDIWSKVHTSSDSFGKEVENYLLRSEGITRSRHIISCFFENIFPQILPVVFFFTVFECGIVYLFVLHHLYKFENTWICNLVMFLFLCFEPIIPDTFLLLLLFAICELRFMYFIDVSSQPGYAGDPSPLAVVLIV